MSEVPKAPVLTFPIPLKPKKTAPAAKTPPQQPVKKVKNVPKPGKKIKESEKSKEEELDTIFEWAKTLKGNIDFRTLPRDERLALHKGPKVAVIAMEKTLSIPLRLAVIASPNIREEFLKTKEIPTVRSPVPALEHVTFDLFSYLKVTSTKFTCFKMKDVEAYYDMDLILAADMLGLTTYVSNIRNWYWAWLKRSPVYSLGDEYLDFLETRLVHLGTCKMTEKVIERFADEWYSYKMAKDYREQLEQWLSVLPNLSKIFDSRVDHWDAIVLEKYEAFEQEKKDALHKQLLIARNGRAGGYGM